MKFHPRLFLLSIFSTIASGAVPLVPDKPLAAKGERIYAEDFSRADLGPEWQTGTPSAALSDGTMKLTQTRDEHGAGVVAKLPLRDGNVILELKFRFAGGRSINVACDDRSFKGVHAGHIARIVLSPKQLSLCDDKEGVMRNDLYALRKSSDPKQKAGGQRLAAGRSRDFPISPEDQRWYRLGLKIVGAEMRVTIDGQPAGYLRSPGLTHANKDDLRIGAWGKDKSGFIDEIRVWDAILPPAK